MKCSPKFSVFAISLLVLFAQPAIAGPLCLFTTGAPAPAADNQPSPLAMQQMSDVNKFLCNRFSCPPYSLFQNSTIGNASAESGYQGYIIRYNSGFMQQEVNQFGTLATIGILAHELGHIIDFANNSQNISQLVREATADEYAGCAFALAGAPPQNLTPFINSLLALGPSGPGYPSAHQRTQLIQQGYNKC